MAENGGLKKEMVTSKSKTSNTRKRDRRKGERRGVEVRDVAKERGGIPIAPSGAMSSFKALFFHDIPPEVLFALANRYTGGHRKYGVGHININWKTGLDDPEYIADRYNHAVTHLISNTDLDLAEQDEHLEGALWNVAFLIVAKKRCPKAFKEAFIQGNLIGKAAAELQAKMKEQLESNHWL
jgi:hypothetical protein